MKEISKQYDFSKEDEIYKLWEDSGLFNPDNIDSKEVYCNISLASDILTALVMKNRRNL